jgi:hypothetical protein
MVEVLIERIIARRTSDDPYWVGFGMRGADLRLRAWDNNLVTFEFVNNDQVLGTYRLCWKGFSGFMSHFDEWFFNQPEDATLAPSCIDKSVIIRCMTHDDFGLSVTIGVDKPELVCTCARSQFLTSMDEIAMILKDQPDAGCFKPTEQPDDNPIRVLH